jgi:hypothetical protein
VVRHVTGTCLAVAAAALAVSGLVGCGGPGLRTNPDTQFPLVSGATVAYSVLVPTGLGPENSRYLIVMNANMSSRQLYQAERARFQDLGWELRGAHERPEARAWVSPQDDLVRFAPTHSLLASRAPTKIKDRIASSRPLQSHGLVVAMVPES